MPNASDIRGTVRAFVERHRLLHGADRVLVGFSGGADSTALLLLLRELHGQVEAIHLHHGLRAGAADRDAEWCQRFCGARSIPFQCHQLDVRGLQRSREGIEAAARRCRLTFWRQAATGQAKVALGHHADDALEGLLLNLARGANTGGLTSLRPERTVCGVRLIRPLLCLRRTDVEFFLQDLGIDDWRCDHTNNDPALRRNAVRHEWLPAIRRTVGHDKGLYRAMDALRQDADFLDTAAADALTTARTADDLRRLHPAVRVRFFRLWLARETGEDIAIARSAVDRLSDALANGQEHAVEIPLPAGRAIVLDADGLRVKTACEALVPREWHWREQPRLVLPESGTVLAAQILALPSATDLCACPPSREWFRAADLPEVLFVRCPKPGDRIVPFGSADSQKVKGLLIDARIPREKRCQVPVILAGEHIIWIAGVRRAEFGRIGKATDKAVVRLIYHSSLEALAQR